MAKFNAEQTQKLADLKARVDKVKATDETNKANLENALAKIKEAHGKMDAVRQKVAKSPKPKIHPVK